MIHDNMDKIWNDRSASHDIAEAKKAKADGSEIHRIHRAFKNIYNKQDDLPHDMSRQV